MRDFVILHAQQDAAAAAVLEHALGGRGAVSCTLRAHAPLGNFGPQFMLVALWSSAAEAEGLGPVMGKMFAGRARPPAVVLVDGARAPAALLTHTAVTLPLTARPDPANEVAARLVAQGALEAPRNRKSRSDHRKATGFAATAATAMFSFAGSAVLAGMTPAAGNLAWAASEDAREPSVIVAPSMAAMVTATVPDTLPNLDPILARAEQIMARAQALSATPAVQARFEIVQRVAASNVDLRLMFTTPVIATAPAATQLAAADVTAPDLNGAAPQAAVSIAHVESAAPTGVAASPPHASLLAGLGENNSSLAGFDFAALN